MENNKLIAEFMGMKLGEDHTNDNMYYDDAENLHPPTPINELKFNSSWDWLMPVIEKIGHHTLSYTIEMLAEYYYKDGDNQDGLDGIEDFYKAVVFWIKNHNRKTIASSILDSAYSRVSELVRNQDDYETIDTIQPILDKIDEVQNEIKSI